MLLSMGHAGTFLIIVACLACSRTELDDQAPLHDGDADHVDASRADASDAAPDEGASDADPCAPMVLADNVGPVAMVLDGDWVYFSGGGPLYAVARVPKSGGKYQMLSDTWSYGIAVDDTYLYWTWGVAQFGTVRRVPKAGGTTEIVASWQGEARAIALDPASLYVTGAFRIWKISKNDWSVKALPTSMSEPMRIAVLGTDLFVTDWFSGLSRMGTDGSNPTLLHAGAYAEYLAVQPGYAFWQDGAGLWVDDFTQTSATSLAKPTVFGVAADDTNVYWASGNEVLRSPKLGGSSSVLVKTALDTRLVAIDDRCLFYATTGGIARALK